MILPSLASHSFLSRLDASPRVQKPGYLASTRPTESGGTESDLGPRQQPSSSWEKAGPDTRIPIPSTHWPLRVFSRAHGLSLRLTLPTMDGIYRELCLTAMAPPRDILSYTWPHFTENRQFCLLS